MSSDRVIETDVLVIGGGLAGFFAAIRARELGADVTIVDKAYAGKSGGAAFAGGHIAVFNPEWGHKLDKWMEFIVWVGEYINDRDWVKIYLEESYPRFQDLVSWGVPLLEKEGKTESLHYLAPAANSNDAIMIRREFMPPIRNKVLECGAKILDRIMVTDLLKQDGRVVGAVGFDTRNGDFYTIKAKATIVATGSGTFKSSGGPFSYWTSDGEAMSYRAGAQMTNKEFGGKDVGFKKDSAGAPRALRGGGPKPHYVNGEGEEFYSRYAPKFNRHHRPMIYWLFEVHAGRGPIFYDLASATPEEKRETVEAYKLTPGNVFEAEKVGFDITKAGKVEMVAGVETGYSGMGYGGVVITTECESTIPGLYAAGDNAGTRFSGSLYAPSGYGIGGAATTGYRAGQSAAQAILKAKGLIIDQKEVARLKENAYMPLSRKGGFSPGWMTEMLRNIMLPYYIMHIKHGERLQAAITLVKFLENHVGTQLKANDAHELRMAHEARNMALNAEMMLKASLFRTESRGTHYREDYPRREDPDWLAWTVIKEEQGEMKLFKQPIPKEWWPDLSTPYKERYDLRFPSEL